LIDGHESPTQSIESLSVDSLIDGVMHFRMARHFTLEPARQERKRRGSTRRKFTASQKKGLGEYVY
jgi:hypothetical protein